MAELEALTHEEEMMSLARRALEHFVNKTTDQAASTLEMPVEAYVGQSRYQAERDRIFMHLPLALALSLELPEPGCYRAMTVMNVPVLLIRGEDDTVRAFINVCTHRGARLCPEGAGERRVISCPYHAWTFDFEGRLSGRYAAETFGDLDPEAYALTELACAERAGVIWVMLTPGEQFDADAWLGGFAEQLGSLHLTDWYLYEQRDLKGPGWKVAMDGYLEIYHHNPLHGATVGQHTVGNLLVLDTYGPHQRLTLGRRTLGTLAEAPESEWAPLEHIRLIHSGFPNLSVSGILGDHCLVSQIFPGEDPFGTVTRQSILVAEKPATDAAEAAARNFSDMVLQAVRDEDYAIGQTIQAGLRAPARAAFIFGRNEPAVQNYHRWVANFMTQTAEARDWGGV
jgi:phenylpropionate dioxygenase-like ring-hydroxylating dioxygenase large terminal subunit